MSGYFKHWKGIGTEEVDPRLVDQILTLQGGTTYHNEPPQEEELDRKIVARMPWQATGPLERAAELDDVSEGFQRRGIRTEEGSYISHEEILEGIDKRTAKRKKGPTQKIVRQTRHLELTLGKEENGYQEILIGDRITTWMDPTSKLYKRVNESEDPLATLIALEPRFPITYTPTRRTNEYGETLVEPIETDAWDAGKIEGYETQQLTEMSKMIRKGQHFQTLAEELEQGTNSTILQERLEREKAKLGGRARNVDNSRHKQKYKTKNQ